MVLDVWSVSRETHFSSQQIVHASNCYYWLTKSHMSAKSFSPVDLTEEQDRLLREYARMLFEVNKQFNLISREDTHQILERHIAHCLTIAEKKVGKGSKIVDWGSGGGLPAIPLAIVWPDAHVLAVDSNGKKTRSIELFCRRLGIKNCESWHGRAEDATGSFQYSVSRATAPLVNLWDWHQRVAISAMTTVTETAIINSDSDASANTTTNADANTVALEPAETHWSQGLICLKGGDLREEVQAMNTKFTDLQTIIEPLSSLEKDPFFRLKYLVHVNKIQSS